MQEADSRSLNRKLLGMTSRRHKHQFETGEILRTCGLIG